MPPLVECVPNFSEGRRPQVMGLIREAIAAHAPVLDLHSDPDHNRSVVTLAGRPEAVFRAAVAGVEAAAASIRMAEHRGEHPRLGAADVVPFVPLSQISMAEVVELARRAGRFIGTRLGLPVYYYGHAALHPGRRRLADVRRSGWEELEPRLGTDPRWQPDAGYPFRSPAGACVVGARELLIAFNVVLEADDLEAARAIAARLRESSGGLASVQALGFRLHGQGRAQVSMNLLDYRRTGLAEAFQAVAAQAGERGLGLAYSEIVGLVPAAAVEGLTPPDLRLNAQRFPLLEERLAAAGLLPAPLA